MKKTTLLLFLFSFVFANFIFSQNQNSKEKKIPLVVVNMDSLVNFLTKEIEIEIQIQRDSMLVLGNNWVKKFQRKYNTYPERCYSSEQMEKKLLKLNNEQMKISLFESVIFDTIPFVQKEFSMELKKAIKQNINKLLPEISFELIIDKNQLLYCNPNIDLTKIALENSDNIKTNLLPIFANCKKEIHNLYFYFKS